MAANLVTGGNPGLRYFRAVAVTNKAEVSTSECSIFAYTFRNASTSPVYLNFYDSPSSSLVTVGTGSGSTVAARLMIPAALDATHPGQLIVTPGSYPLRWFATGCTICPVTTDTDAATAAGTVYVEIQWAGQPST